MLRHSVAKAAESLYPFTLSRIGLAALLRGLVGAVNNEWNMRTFAGEVRRYYWLMENR